MCRFRCACDDQVKVTLSPRANAVGNLFYRVAHLFTPCAMQGQSYP
jgi:hypothetical protein